ncbi:5-methyltetrahydropteroyltriglutamate-homocysteine methyltransferase [Epithele typhae]|uniref:5-methyltetrahydropteroyltriglutamate- homocysteine methyltransferase n=1 Tax=Epithele typhae TaxID=378194 RepID=UPI0020075B96|nr:5-methyltetrahydropteroyltriglutamate-homocysteine methyltransferase [Epithele typhae]KAH9943490.1 5-methyltetrahydropteroyltriglutamate-homocysteine methyltransferase [Epithele typhae]
MVYSSVLGSLASVWFTLYARANREVKKAVEAYWGGKLSADELTKAAADVKKASWTSLKERGVELIPSGDFTLYDHRYLGKGLSPLDVYFAMGRGRQAEGVDVPACEMKKWFDSNYHFVVPEFSEETEFKLNFNKALEEYREAKDLGVETRPVVLGPSLPRSRQGCEGG